MSFTESAALFGAALTVSLPTFGWVLLGVVLARLGLLSEYWINLVSRLAFNYGLPVMLFAGAAGVDYSAMGGADYLLAGVLATLATAGLAWAYSGWRGHELPLRGIFVQAAFRSNLAIVGIALAVSAYGERGPQLAALPVAVMTALYNVLAVWVLDVSHGGRTSAVSLVKGILSNPLIIGILAGVVLSLSPLPVPALVDPLSAGLSTFFLPLMLVCIGGSIRLGELRRAGAYSWEASVWRLCVAPLVAVVLALLLGVHGEALGVLFLLVASPVAASSFVMVVAVGGDGALAARVVVLTTLLSAITVTLGFYLLSLLSLVGQLA